MIKKYVYTGVGIFSKGKLGFVFREIEDKEKVLCWVSKKGYYIIGGIYEIDFDSEKNKIITSSIKYLDENVGDDETKQMVMKDKSIKAEIRANNVIKKLKKEREDLGKITLEELKNNYKLSRSSKIALVMEYLL